MTKQPQCETRRVLTKVEKAHFKKKRNAYEVLYIRHTFISIRQSKWKVGGVTELQSTYGAQSQYVLYSQY